jgi:predicted dehydrogenase
VAGADTGGRHLRLGIVGAGGFASFAVSHLLDAADVVAAAVADVDPARAAALAGRLGVEALPVDDLVTHPGVDVVYIATPPSSHAPLGLRALAAGKHVLCEKPLGLSVADADAVVTAAREANRLAVANLLQRYNPLARAVGEVLRRELLGAPLRVAIENLAADERLPPGHWFWDRDTSGGIFVEHGVHFFDLFAFWFGAGEVLAAARVLRPGSGEEEQVCCTVAYPHGVIGDVYHGFHQPGRLDRTRIRVVCERGDVTLDGWIPVMFRIEALVDDDTEAALYALFADCRVVREERLREAEQDVTGRHRAFRASRHVVLAGGEAGAKMERYGDLVHRLFADQLAWARNHEHVRLLDEQASRDAVALACAADAHSVTVRA